MAIAYTEDISILVHTIESAAKRHTSVSDRLTAKRISASEEALARVYSSTGVARKVLRQDYIRKFGHTPSHYCRLGILTSHLDAADDPWRNDYAAKIEQGCAYGHHKFTKFSHITDPRELDDIAGKSVLSRLQIGGIRVKGGNNIARRTIAAFLKAVTTFEGGRADEGDKSVIYLEKVRVMVPTEIWLGRDLRSFTTMIIDTLDPEHLTTNFAVLVPYKKTRYVDVYFSERQWWPEGRVVETAYTSDFWRNPVTGRRCSSDTEGAVLAHKKGDVRSTSTVYFSNKAHVFRLSPWKRDKQYRGLRAAVENFINEHNLSEPRYLLPKLDYNLVSVRSISMRSKAAEFNAVIGRVEEHGTKYRKAVCEWLGEYPESVLCEVFGKGSTPAAVFDRYFAMSYDNAKFYLTRRIRRTLREKGRMFVQLNVCVELVRQIASVMAAHLHNIFYTASEAIYRTMKECDRYIEPAVDFLSSNFASRSQYVRYYEYESTVCRHIRSFWDHAVPKLEEQRRFPEDILYACTRYNHDTGESYIVRSELAEFNRIFPCHHDAWIDYAAHDIGARVHNGQLIFESRPAMEVFRKHDHEELAASHAEHARRAGFAPGYAGEQGIPDIVLRNLSPHSLAMLGVEPPETSSYVNVYDEDRFAAYRV